MKIVNIIVDELPESCGICAINNDGYCVLKGLTSEDKQEWVGRSERNKKCPLIVVNNSIESDSSFISLEELDFSVRIYNCLKRAGINTKYELEQLTEDDVMRIRNIDSKSLDGIKEKIKLKGIV